MISKNSQKRSDTTQRKFHRVWRLLIVLILGFGLFCLLAIGCAANTADRYELLWWEYLMCIPMNISLFALFLWPLAEVLPTGLWQRRVFVLMLCLVLPGLLAAAPGWFFGFRSMWSPGDGPIGLRLAVAAVPLILAAGLTHYVRVRIKEKS